MDVPLSRVAPRGGLDTEGLIEALTTSRRLPADELESDIEENNKEITALSSLETTLTAFRKSVDLLRNPPGVKNEDENIFEYRNAVVGGNTSGGAPNYLSVTAEPGASLSSYDVKIDTLATYNTKITNTFSIADEDAVFVGSGGIISAGDFRFGSGNQTVTFEDGDTLNEAVAKLNAVQTQSGVEASILQVADGEYRLVLRSTSTGTEANYTLDTLPSAAPSFMKTDSVLYIDANDIDGDGDYTNNPASDETLTTIADISGTATVNAEGDSPQLDVDAASSGAAQIDFSSNNSTLVASRQVDINTSGPYSQKTMAISFTTGTDVSGNQFLYKQGGSARGFSLQIQEDASNGNEPTLYAVFYDNLWDATDQLKVLNLGTVSAETDYQVVIEMDASGNPSVNDAGNTLTGYVNGTQVAQETGLRRLSGHTYSLSVGGIAANSGGVMSVSGSISGSDTGYFSGQIGELAQFNRVLTSDEHAELNDYFSRKYNRDVFETLGFASENDATDASITIDGTTITRSDNSFNDVIDNLSFSLLSTTAVGETLTVSVQADTDLVKTAVTNFVDAYNAFRVFMSEQTEIGDDGTATEDAVLSGSSALRTISARINAEVTQIIDGITTGNYDRLADIGLSFEDYEGDAETQATTNILVIDEAKLTSAVTANFDQVRTLFEFDLTTNDPNVSVYERTNALDVTSITLNINRTSDVYEATYLDENNISQTVSLAATSLSSGGLVLDGIDGTVLEGLQLIYSSNEDATGILVSFTQGIGDRIFNAIDSILDEDDGLLATEIDALTEVNSRYEEEIDRIDEIVERYRESLISQYSALEIAIAEADLILQSLSAQNDARLSAS